MTSNKKKINIPISSLSSEEIYALLEDTDSNYEEEIDNLMNDSDTEPVGRTTIENSESDISEVLIREKDDSSGSNFILTTKPIDPVVKIAKPDSESEYDGDDVPLSNLLPKKNVIWKWNKHFEKPALKKCNLAEEGIVSINFENSSSFQLYPETIGLEELLTLIEIESEKYAAQNGRVFQTTNDELAAFLGINILVGIKHLPAIKDYWSVEEGLGNRLIQKAMTRARFWEILQNMHFADKLQSLPPRNSEQYDRVWKLQPLFDYLLKNVQEATQPEPPQ